MFEVIEMSNCAKYRVVPKIPVCSAVTRAVPSVLLHRAQALGGRSQDIIQKKKIWKNSEKIYLGKYFKYFI